MILLRKNKLTGKLDKFSVLLQFPGINESGKAVSVCLKLDNDSDRPTLREALKSYIIILERAGMGHIIYNFDHTVASINHSEFNENRLAFATSEEENLQVAVSDSQSISLETFATLRRIFTTRNSVITFENLAAGAVAGYLAAETVIGTAKIITKTVAKSNPVTGYFSVVIPMQWSTLSRLVDGFFGIKTIYTYTFPSHAKFDSEFIKRIITEAKTVEELSPILQANPGLAEYLTVLADEISSQDFQRDLRDRRAS